MFHKNKISVVLCTYNGEKYIADQLESIKKQTVQPDEIVIIDDASKDNTVQRVQEVVSGWRNKVVLLINDVNIGYKKNFARALQNATGDIVFLSDQDDWWESTKIEKQMIALEQHPQILLCFHDALLVDAKLNSLGITFWKSLKFIPISFKKNDYSRFSIDSMVQGCSCAFRRELINISFPFCEEAHHDEWLAMNAVMHGGILPINECLLRYRQTGNNTLGASVEGTYNKILKWINNIEDPMNRHIKNIYRKYEVWNAFIEKYGNKIPFLKMNGADYRAFFKKRKYCFEKNKYWRLPSIFLYLNAYSDRMFAIKMYIKDRLMFLFRDGYLKSFH